MVKIKKIVIIVVILLLTSILLGCGVMNANHGEIIRQHKVFVPDTIPSVVKPVKPMQPVAELPPLEL